MGFTSIPLTRTDVDLVFIDETGVNLSMTRRYARAKKGKRAYGKCPYNRGRNVTLISAISLKSILASLTFEGWTTQEAFLTYVTAKIEGSCHQVQPCKVL